MGGVDRALLPAEEAAEDAALLGLLGGASISGWRRAVGGCRLAVARGYRAWITADAAGAPVGLALAGEAEVEVDAGHALDRARPGRCP